MKRLFSTHVIPFRLLGFFLSVFLLVACKASEEPKPTVEEPLVVLSKVDSATYRIGIPLYTADQGKEFWTEFNSQMRPLESSIFASAELSLMNREGNPFLKCAFKTLPSAGFAGVRMATFRTLFDNSPMPPSVAGKVTGVRFNAMAFAEPMELTLEALDVDGALIASETYLLEKEVFSSYQLAITSDKLKQLQFTIKDANQVINDTLEGGAFALDDVYLMNGSTEPFTPPTSDQEFLTWLKKSAFNFFDWNFKEVESDKGIVSESYIDQSKISLSGLGFGYAIYVVAELDGLLEAAVVKDRIIRMLKWQLDQNWFDGSGGWHGFPHHYFKPDGSNYWPDVSTIDWAICAAGIRVVKQHYSSDAAIVSMADELLARPDWTVALAEDNKIAMGFDGNTGEMNAYRWALAFSEETELVYLEAVASGDLNGAIFTAIERKEKSGFYPSWFGAGFTYNWLQLWTGSIEPFISNSVAAYENDAATCLKAFGRPLMGLTACSTVKSEETNGFLSWSEYISNQGGSIHGAGSSVIQVSPAPYGAALALPFTYDQSITALREYVEMGYYHEYLGLPDNVRMKSLKGNMLISPNWNPYDINIGPVLLAIEQIQNNHVGTLYLKDQDIANALSDLINAFPK